MKNLLKITLMLIVAGLFFSACKTASITKRHYTKGYYVSHSGKKHKLPANANEGTLQATTAQTLPQKESGLNDVAAEKEIIPSAIDHSSSIKAPTSDKGEQRRTKKIENNGDANDDITFNEPDTKQFIKNPLKLSKAVAAKATSDDAYSLIWILIVVLLVIYIVGLFMDSFGLGGLIHILGVIALVLLVLWLLKVI